MHKHHSIKGFTIVEILVVIVVIGILAAIGILSYNGVKDRALNTQTIASVKQSVNLLRMYYTEHGSWPTGWDRDYQTQNSPQHSQKCLGTNLPTYNNRPEGHCTDYTGSLRPESNVLHETLEPYGHLPGAIEPPVSGTRYPLQPIYDARVFPVTFLPDLKYPDAAPTFGQQQQSQFAVWYSMRGVDLTCGNIPHSQPGFVSNYWSSTTTVCIILLEYYQ